MKPSAKLAIAALAVVGIGGGLWFLRRETNGLRNAFSPTYWAERKGGIDLYSPQKHLLKKGRRDLKQVLLTIDDGPHPSIAGILDTLKEKRCPAVFFVVGKQVDKYPQLIKRMIDEGHEVGNHTYNHLRLTKLSSKQVHEEIEKCEKSIEKATGRKTKLLRPPGMDFNDAIIHEITNDGLYTVHWTVGAKDFTAAPTEGHMTVEIAKTLSVKPDQVVERVLKQVTNGSIILLHDIDVSAKALPTVIDKVRAAGYEFVSAESMLESLPRPVHIKSNPPVKP